MLSPALLVLAALAEASDSPMRFDSARPPNSVDFTYWSVSVNCLVVAILPTVAGLWTLKTMWRQTRQLFSLNILFLAIGAFGLWGMALALYGLSQKGVDSRFYYYSFASGTAGSVVFTVFASVVFGPCILGFGLIYTSGVVSEGSGKYDRRPGEVDPLGQMIQEQVRQKALRP